MHQAATKETSVTLTKAEVLAKRDELKKSLDSVSEVTQTDMMNLQDAMDQQQQILAMLSSLLKQMQETQKAIIQNTKA